MSDKKRHCSLCYGAAPEDAAILTVGRLGNPRYLCEECDALLEKVTGGQRYEEIKEAWDALSEKIAEAANEDQVVEEALAEVFTNAKERADKIKEGTYDFSLDEEETSDEVETDSEGLAFGLDDPEVELTEEQKAEQARKEKLEKQINTISNWVCGGIFVGVLLVLLWYIFF